MRNMRIFGPFWLLTATFLVLTLNGCGSGNAAIKAAEEKEAETLAATGGSPGKIEGDPPSVAKAQMTPVATANVISSRSGGKGGKSGASSQ